MDKVLTTTQPQQDFYWWHNYCTFHIMQVACLSYKESISALLATSKANFSETSASGSYTDLSWEMYKIPIIIIPPIRSQASSAPPKVRTQAGLSLVWSLASVSNTRLEKLTFTPTDQTENPNNYSYSVLIFVWENKRQVWNNARDTEHSAAVLNSCAPLQVCWY